MLHSRKSFLQLLGVVSISSISPQLAGAHTDLTNQAVPLEYVRLVHTAQVTYHSIKGRYTDRIDKLSSVAKLLETPTGWRLTIAVHDDKWDVVLLQENMDAIIFVTDQTGMIRRGMISPIRSLGRPPAPPSA